MELTFKVSVQGLGGLGPLIMVTQDRSATLCDIGLILAAIIRGLGQIAEVVRLIVP